MGVPAHFSNRGQKYERNFTSTEFGNDTSAKLEILYSGNFLEAT